MENNKKENIVEQKSFLLAVRIVNLYKFLANEKKEFTLSKQLLRSGTGIGANVKEAISGYTKPDFRAKFSIAHKEACETEYWLSLLYETKYISKEQYESIFQDTHEVNKIISKILITTKNP